MRSSRDGSVLPVGVTWIKKWRGEVNSSSNWPVWLAFAAPSYRSTQRDSDVNPPVLLAGAVQARQTGLPIGRWLSDGTSQTLFVTQRSAARQA